MTDVINYFMTVCNQVFTLIKSQWLLSIFFLINIFAFIVNLINQSQGTK